MTGSESQSYSGPISLADSARLSDHLALCANIIFHETAAEQPGDMPDGTRPIKNTTGIKQWTNHTPQSSRSKNQSSCRWLQPEAVFKLMGFPFLISDATAESLSVMWSTWTSALLKQTQTPEESSRRTRCSHCDEKMLLTFIPRFDPLSSVTGWGGGKNTSCKVSRHQPPRENLIFFTS